MAKVQKFVRSNLDELYENYIGAGKQVMRKKSKIELKKSMTKDQFY